MFTFIVTTYNQERLILDTLESIKYQVTHYGQNRRIELVVSDDASTDGTMSVVDFWLSLNEDLFTDVTLLRSETNKGPVYNYLKGIRAAKGDIYKEIAGDDLFSTDNIFEIMDNLKTYDLISGPFLMFRNKEIYIDYKSYRAFIAYSFLRYKKLKEYFKLSHALHNSSIAWKKELLTEPIMRYMEEQFKYVEDQPQMYRIFMDNEHLNYRYINKIPVLYRRSNQSISGSMEFRNITKAERVRLIDEKQKNEKNPLMKWSLWCGKQVVRDESSQKYIKFINPFWYLMQIKYIIYHKKITGEINRLKNEEFPKQQEYLNALFERSEEIWRSYQENGENRK